MVTPWEAQLVNNMAPRTVKAITMGRSIAGFPLAVAPPIVSRISVEFYSYFGVAVESLPKFFCPSHGGNYPLTSSISFREFEL